MTPTPPQRRSSNGFGPALIGLLALVAGLVLPPLVGYVLDRNHFLGHNEGGLNGICMALGLLVAPFLGPVSLVLALFFTGLSKEKKKSAS